MRPTAAPFASSKCRAFVLSAQAARLTFALLEPLRAGTVLAASSDATAHFIRTHSRPQSHTGFPVDCLQSIACRCHFTGPARSNLSKTSFQNLPARACRLVLGAIVLPHACLPVTIAAAIGTTESQNDLPKAGHPDGKPPGHPGLAAGHDTIETGHMMKVVRPSRLSSSC